MKLISDWKMISLLAFLFIGAPSAALAEEEEEANEVEEIVVTGSRIVRSSADSDSNISIISREEIEDLGVTSIGDFRRTSRRTWVDLTHKITTVVMDLPS